MKVWGDKRLAQGIAEDELYRYHIMVLIEDNIVIALGVRNRK